MKKARVIITFDCFRNCQGCCNKYGTIMKNAKSLQNITDLKNYDVVMITGGEPMLYPNKVIDLTKSLKKENPNIKVYLYTANHKNAWDLEQVLQYVDGIQYSLHSNATGIDMDDFQCFQAQIFTWADVKSFRLYIDQSIKGTVHITPDLWQRIEIKPWLTESQLLAQQPNGLPQEEELFILQN